MAKYTVKSGDTLSAIAKKNGTTVSAIAKASGISNPNLIYAGQKITIPNSNTSSNKTSNNSNNKTTKNNTSSNTLKIEGVDDSVTKTINSKYQQSDEVKNLGNKTTGALGNLESLVNKGFTAPESYTNAMTYLDGQLSQIQSGRTSYTDKINDMMLQIENREDFSYDVDNDQLFQQALASAMNSGKTAMQDTIGQASALTGGYGSSYATSVGNQTYNDFIEDAYNNLPQYYQMELEAYQAEGEDMYRQLGMYVDADTSEWNKLVTSFDATSQYADSIYNKAWDEYATDIDNAYKMYDAYNTEYTTKYGQEYASWYDAVTNAKDIATMQQTNYWNDKEFTENQRQFDATQGLREKEYKISTGDTDGDGVLSASEKAAMNTSDIDNIPKPVNTRAAKLETDSELESYLDNQVDAGIITESQADYLYNVYKSPSTATNDNAVNINLGKVKDGTFRTNKNDNFYVNYNGESYGVENEGKVDDTDLIEELNNVGASNNDVFLYDGDAYLKYANGYYKIGAKEQWLGLTQNDNYQLLLKELQKQ